ncbi:helix-turn-helix transcriptional regulator [[Clostridium] innocuum]|nr:helix-turn-helix transcriptional regulator [[Clostridium] innocuum]MCR0576256.1 helix-turn-helix transcriptional regulator [[Clostridium] innocuum]
MFNRAKLQEYIENIGVKQKVISQKTGISETALSSILTGKRRCEVNEFFAICKAIGAEPTKFICNDDSR